MILEKYNTGVPDINGNNSNILYLYNKTNIDKKGQYIINDIIRLFDIDNELLVYTYMVKNRTEYIIYKGVKRPSEFELKHTGVKSDELIYIDIIYQSDSKTIRIDISIRSKDINSRHLVLYNSKDFNIEGLTITPILKYYNCTLESLKRTRYYDPAGK